MAVSFQFIQTHSTTAQDQRRSDDRKRSEIHIDLTPSTSSAMAPDSDTRPNFIKWFKDTFGFSTEVATALYDDQLLRDAMTNAEFGDSEMDSVCRTLCRDSSLPIAELAVTRLKLMTFWVRHQHRTSRVIGGV